MAAATAKTSGHQATVDRLLDRFGTTFATDAGFTVRDTPGALYRLLCLTTLLSTRIRATVAVAAARALADAGWTTVDKMRGSTWDERTRVLNRSGYARYDGRTSTMLGRSAELLHQRYGDDLRRLRQAAQRDPDAERRLLKEFAGIGDVGVDIFFREVQGVWGEVYPFLGRRTADNAERLGLPTDAERLATLVPPDDFGRLAAALVKVGLAGGHDNSTKRPVGRRPRQAGRPG